jgi:hypothetical protein
MPDPAEFDPAEFMKMAQQFQQQNPTSTPEPSVHPEIQQQQQQEPPEQEPPPEPPPSSGLREAFSNMGYDTAGFQDDNQLLEAIQSQTTENARLQHQLQQSQAVQSQLAQQYEEAGRPQPPPEEGPWNPPEFDPRWNQLLTIDESTGRYVPRASAYSVPYDIVKKANDYAEHWSNWTQDFRKNPYDTMWKGLQSQVEDLVSQQIEAYQHQQAASTQADQILTRYAPAFYVMDQNGQPQVDPVTRQERLTPLGERLRDHIGEADNLGIQDPVKRQEFALQKLERDLVIHQYQQQQQALVQQQFQQLSPEQQQQYLEQQQQQQQQQQPPRMVQQSLTQNQYNDQLKQQYAQRGAGATYAPSRDGSAAAVAEAVGNEASDPTQEFLDLAIDDLRRNGHNV